MVGVLPAVVAGILACMAAVDTSGSSSSITAERITFPGHGLELAGVIYKPRGYDSVGGKARYSAVVLMHGCSGMWSERKVGSKNRNGSPNLQNNIEKWGIKLAESNVVALAVDSFTPRTPPDVTSSEEWQNQCSENPGRYSGCVNPYTDRVDDARAAWEFLNALPQIDGTKIGLLGWSHGAQAVMVEAAETGRESNVPRAESDHKFVCSVAFYPGCGPNLGFVIEDKIDSSFWRPFRPMQLHMGMCDPFYDNCVIRKKKAAEAEGESPSTHGVPLEFKEYAGARHHFDALSQAWPSNSARGQRSEVNDSRYNADQSAMRKADPAALKFILSALQPSACM